MTFLEFLEAAGMIFVVFCVLDLIFINVVLGYLLKEFDKMDDKIYKLSQIVFENEKKYDRDIGKIMSKMRKIVEILVNRR